MAANPAPQLLQSGQKDPLAALRDIHLPMGIDTWPPAPGWWLLAALCLLLLGYGLYRVYHYWKSNAYRREARKALEQIHLQYHDNPGGYLIAYTTLLKRVALSTFPRDKVASLTGEAWVAFLDETGTTHEFSMGAGQIMIEGIYAPNTDQTANHRHQSDESNNPIDVEALHSIAKLWIKRHKPTPSVPS